MKIFTKPQKLNGDILKEELAAAGIIVSIIRDFGDNTIGFETDNESVAEQVVAAHNPPPPTEPTIAEKLALVGLNLEDLKIALGI